MRGLNTSLAEARTQAAAYLSERVVAILVSGIIGVLVARHLGPSDLGILAYVLAVFGLGTPLATLGMKPILLHRFASRSEIQKTLTDALTLQFPAAIVVTVAAYCWVAAFRPASDQALITAVALLPLPILALSDSMRAYLESAGRAKSVVKASLAGVTLSSLMKLLGIALDAPIWFFAASTTVEAAIVALMVTRQSEVRPHIHWIRPRLPSYSVRSLWHDVWPMLLASVAVILYVRIDVVMLGIFSSDFQTGTYVAAVRISELWHFVPMAAAAALHPAISRLHHADDLRSHAQATQQFLSLAWGAAFLAASSTFALAQPLVAFLYGDAFADSVGVLRIHVLGMPFVFLGVAGGQWFIDKGLMRFVLKRSAVGAALNIGMNAILIPSFGASGAAAATFVAYASGVFFNGLDASARPLFVMQCRALRFAWRSSAAPNKRTNDAQEPDVGADGSG